MKFLNKLYRFIRKSINTRRLNIFLLVNLFFSVALTLCALTTSAIGTVVFMVLFIVAAVFNIDVIVWGGDIIDSIEDKVLEFKKFE